jgi:hypothetical protein
MNIAGSTTGEGASQAREAVQPPPSKENVTARGERQASGLVGWGERARWRAQAQCAAVSWAASGGDAVGIAPTRRAAVVSAAHPRTARQVGSNEARKQGCPPSGQALGRHETPKTLNRPLFSTTRVPAATVHRSASPSRSPRTSGRGAGRQRWTQSPLPRKCSSFWR